MARSSSYIPLFFLTALLVLYLCHYFVYFSFVHLLEITSVRRKFALGAALFLLATSFIVSSILAHRSLNVFSRALYFFSSLWIGVGLTLVFFLVLAWAAWGATRLVVHSPGPAVFAWGALVLAGAYSVYGVWNANHVRLRQIQVRLKNLPTEWQGKKVVQISDVHLGYLRDAKFLRSLVDKTNAENPSAVFITGDLFDGSNGRLQALVAPLSKLRAPRGVYFITGNHETYLGVERALQALEKTPVRVLNDEMVTLDGLQVIGVSYPQRGFSKDVASVIGKLPEFDPKLPSILLYHNPSQTEQARAAGINLQLAGHTHQGQIFPFQFVTWLTYRQYYRGLHVEGDYTIYTTSGAGTWGPMLRTGNHPEIVSIRLL